jgi:hypothetical protein
MNSSIANTAQVTPRVYGLFVPPRYNVIGGSIPTPLFGGVVLCGSNPVGGTGHSFTYGFQIPLVTQPRAGGKPQFGGQPQIGTQSQLGGQPHTRFHHLIYGQNASATPNP